MFRVVRQKCPSSSAKKRHFERPEPRTDPKNPAKHPPKWWGRHLVHMFPFSGEYQANFWKLLILCLSGALFPLPRTPNFKWLAQWHLWVYKFENCFLGSPNHSEHALRWTKSTAKNFYFWPRLMCMIRLFSFRWKSRRGLDLSSICPPAPLMGARKTESESDNICRREMGKSLSSKRAGD